MFGANLAFAILLCGSGVVISDTIPLLKLMFVSPETTVSACGNDYQIKSTCIPVIFEDDVTQVPTSSIFPALDQQDPGVKADILRSKPQVFIEDYDTDTQTRDPWNVGTYCILMGNRFDLASYADASTPYIYWLVCDIPGNQIEKGTELVPYEFMPLTLENSQYSIWMFRVENPGEHYDVSRFTSQDCGTSDRCMFNIANFVSTYGLTEVYNGVIIVQPGIWTAKKALDNGLAKEGPVCELLDNIPKTDPTDLPDDGFRDICHERRVHIGELFLNSAIPQYGDLGMALFRTNPPVWTCPKTNYSYNITGDS